MKLDIIMILTLMLSIMFLLGATGSWAAHKAFPETNITQYADNQIANLSANLSRVQPYNVTGRMAIIQNDTTEYFYKLSYQTYASGIEFGFENYQIPPEAYSTLALGLALFWLLADHLSFLLIPVAIVIMIKRWLRGE
jgi:hypothetical protein